MPGQDNPNAGDLQQEQDDQDVADLCKQHGLDYLKEARDLIEDGLDDLGKFLEAEKSKQPDLYTDFKLLRMRANFFTFYAKVAWLRAALEASERELDKESPCTVPGLKLAFEELGRHFPAAKYKLLRSPEQAKRRGEELHGLAREVGDAERATSDLGYLATISKLTFDEGKDQFMIHCQQNFAKRPEGQLQAVTSHADIWQAFKETGSGTLPLETSLNKLSFKVPAEKDRFWSYMVDVFENKDYGLQFIQQDLLVRVAAYARTISLILGLAPRGRLERLRRTGRHSSHAMTFVDSFAEHMPKFHIGQTNSWTSNDIEKESNRFWAYAGAEDMKYQLAWMVVEEV